MTPLFVSKTTTNKANMSKRRTLADFINEAQRVHGERYNYSKVKYVRADIPVCIGCPEHGEFWQKPVVHINLKCKCPLCANKEVSKRFADTKDVFIEKARKVHGEKYDYTKVEYKNNSTDVIIICPKHGAFKQRPANHLNGRGCPYCSGVRMNLQSFLEKARDTHGDTYDYSLVSEYNYYKKITVICKKHGKYEVLPSAHLSGCICPQCNRENLRSGVVGGGIADIATTRGDKIRARWAGMFERCYSTTNSNRAQTYKDCEVCEEWKLLSNFKSWCENPENGYHEDYHIDKDLLSEGSKVYSPKTCCFLPSEINEQFRSVIARRSKYPLGVRPYKRKFVATLSSKYLGSSETPEGAFLLYKEAKEKRVRELAEKYYSRGEITKRVYEAMMRWELKDEKY